MYISCLHFSQNSGFCLYWNCSCESNWLSEANLEGCFQKHLPQVLDILDFAFLRFFFHFWDNILSCFPHIYPMSMFVFPGLFISGFVFYFDADLSSLANSQEGLSLPPLPDLLLRIIYLCFAPRSEACTSHVVSWPMVGQPLHLLW